MTDALARFTEPLRRWFESRFDAPTHVQSAAWPAILEGEHILATAPTGSGKTLTAFFCALDRFARGDWEPGRTRVLYISPLKALNNDIRVNLLEPLEELREAGALPELRVTVRSGDTPQSERQRMLRAPPDILITTPESLHLLLTTERGKQALASVQTVIIDEVHALADNRRGAQLMVSIERLAHIAGEFQRIALSATVEPLEAVARYVAGCRPDGSARRMQTIASNDQKQLALSVRFPDEARNAAETGQKIWDPLADDFRDRIQQNQSTLFFTNSRRLAEKITMKINEKQPEPLAYAHHGSLARDIRAEVEKRLKAGELKAIIATSSLEMGIDIGALDEVVMVQSPPTIAAAMQRIGRAGHQVGATSVGTLYPTHAHDVLEAAVLTEQIKRREIEPLTPMEGPLDVLVQVLVSMCAHQPRHVDDLYSEITCAGSYTHLSRAQFDLVIEMLAGRYAGARVRELKPRLEYDRLSGMVKSTRGALMAMYSSGGNIPDRGYFTLRHADSGNPIGELDEEFVWEAVTGQVFTLGTQNWQIQRITHNDVLVRLASPDATAPPFWRAETFNRGFYFAERILRFLEGADRTLDQGDATAMTVALQDRNAFDAGAAEELVDYLSRQREHTGTALPHRHHVLLELVEGGPDGYRGPNAPKQLVLHTLWGGALNRPFAYALEAALKGAGEASPEVHADDNAIVVQMQDIPDPTQVLGLVTSGNLDGLLREGLESSGFFGARFRECAGRALLLTKQRFNQRLPLWMSRLQAKKLMTATKGYTDFPVLLETWRTCLQDEFDLPALRAMLDELADGTCAWSFAHTRSPSPFAAVVRFEQVSRYMYADDSPETDETSALSADLIAAAVQDPDLRPDLLPAVIEAFEAKRQRTAPGYAPTDDEDALAWLKERVLIPLTEWLTLNEGMENPLEHRYVTHLTAGERRWVCHLEHLHPWLALGAETNRHPPDLPDPLDPVQACLEVLSFYGPLTRQRINALLPAVPEEVWDSMIPDVRVAGAEATHWCDAENLDTLLRFQRARARRSIEPLKAQRLPALWATLQRFGRAATGNTNAIGEALELLSGAPAPVGVWLNDVIPARLAQATTADLDQAFAEQGFLWYGVDTDRITVCYPEDEALRRATAEPDETLAQLFADPNARYTFQQLADVSPDTAALNGLWWQAVWQGHLTCDGLGPLRDAAARRFSLAGPATVTSRRQRLRGLVRGWQGTWQLARSDTADDALTGLEHNKERARVLLERYGVLCRELCVREGWRWRDLFRALRIMELAGEVVQGYYVEGLSGPQFATPAGIQRLTMPTPPPDTWWVNATDPASPCGLGLDWPELPQRRGANYLAFQEGELALVVENGGKKLTYLVPADDSNLDAIHTVIVHLVTTVRRVEIREINGEDARRSPYLAALSRVLDVTSDHKSVYAQT